MQQNIDMEPYRIQQTGSGQIALARKAGMLNPASAASPCSMAPEELEPLSCIIAELNDRFSLDLGPEHRVTIDQIIKMLDQDPARGASRVNT